MGGRKTRRRTFPPPRRITQARRRRPMTSPARPPPRAAATPARHVDGVQTGANLTAAERRSVDVEVGPASSIPSSKAASAPRRASSALKVPGSFEDRRRPRSRQVSSHAAYRHAGILRCVRQRSVTDLIRPTAGTGCSDSTVRDCSVLQVVHAARGAASDSWPDGRTVQLGRRRHIAWRSRRPAPVDGRCLVQPARTSGSRVTGERAPGRHR